MTSDRLVLWAVSLILTTPAWIRSAVSVSARKAYPRLVDDFTYSPSGAVNGARWPRMTSRCAALDRLVGTVRQAW